MRELFFPVFGTMVVFLAAVPLLTLVAYVIFATVPVSKNSIEQQGKPWRYALSVAPTLVPVIWLVSAAVHQSEQGAPLAACVIDHLGGEFCQDVVLFGLLLFAILGVGILRRLRSAYNPHRNRRVSVSSPINKRLNQVCARRADLLRFADRIRVVEQGRAPVCTRGLFRPRIEIEADTVDRLSDDELEAVLLHELEHAHAGDPFRLFVAQVALTINPLGRLLEAEFARYCFAREALCDRRAVQFGADPISLARSIVAVAGQRPTPKFTAALGGHGLEGIRVRVHLLLDYAAHRPKEAIRRGPTGVLMTALVLLAVLPHFTGTGLLDALHRGVEGVAVLIGII